MAGSFTRKGSTPSKLPYSAKRQNTSILNFFQKTDAPTSRQPRITQFASATTRTERNGSKTASAGGRNVVTGTRSRGTDSGDGSGSLFLEDWNGAEPENGFANDRKDDEVDVFERDEEFFGLDENEEPVGKRLDGNPNKEDDEPGRPLTPDLDENGTPIKRRKVDSSLPDGNESQSVASTIPPSKQSGPFIDESDSEGEDLSAFQEVEEEGFAAPAKEDSTTVHAHERRSLVDVPPLVREATSRVNDDEYAGFDDAEEHEFREEGSLEPLVDEECRLDKDDPNNILDTPDEESNGVDICPICQQSLVGLNEVSFTRLYMIQY